MNSDDDLETTLAQLGADDGPPADPGFANRLDAALRAAHSEQARDRRQRPVWVPVTAGLSALAAVVVGGLIWLVAFAGDPAADVVMTAAVDTEVVLPGEAASAGEAGLSLPDGTRIVVGPEGEAVVDGVVLGPGTEAIINDGGLDVIGPARSAPPDRGGVVPETSEPTSIPPTMSTTGPDAADGSDRETSSSTQRSTSTTNERPTTSAPTTTTTRRPEPTDGSRATTTQTSSTRPTTTTATTATTTATTDPAPLSIALSATPVPRSRIRLDWIVEGGPDPAGFRVEATEADRTSTILLIRSSGARSTTIERLPPGVSYRVIAVTEDGTTLQSSNSVPQPSP